MGHFLVLTSLRDESLRSHTEFLETLGIAGISHHSLLYSKTAPVQVVDEEMEVRWYFTKYCIHQLLSILAFNSVKQMGQNGFPFM